MCSHVWWHQHVYMIKRWQTDPFPSSIHTYMNKSHITKEVASILGMQFLIFWNALYGLGLWEGLSLWGLAIRDDVSDGSQALFLKAWRAGRRGGGGYCAIWILWTVFFIKPFQRFVLNHITSRFSLPYCLTQLGLFGFLTPSDLHHSHFLSISLPALYPSKLYIISVFLHTSFIKAFHDYVKWTKSNLTWIHR